MSVHYQRPVFTMEQASLFAALCEEKPGAAVVDWESVAIDELDGKRFLCLMYFTAAMERPIYLHFHPEGATREEMEALTLQHGMDSIDCLDGEK